MESLDSRANIRWSGVSLMTAAVARGVSSAAMGLSATGVGTPEQGRMEPGVLEAAELGVCAKGSLPATGGVGALGASTSTRSTSEVLTDIREQLDSMAGS